MKIIIVLLAAVACAVAYPNPRYYPGYDGPDMNVYSNYDNQPRSSLVEDSDYDSNSGVVMPSGPAANFNPFAYQPLGTFIERMQGMMRRVQTQMGEVLSRLPPQDIDWSKLGNTTSHTQIVNDHVVTVNETTYKNPDDALGAVLQIKVVDVRPTPSNSPSTTFEGTSESTVDSDDKLTTMEDKIRNSRASIVRRYFPNGQIMKRQYPQEYARMIPEVVDNAVDVFPPTHPIDLSRDTLVNDVRRDQTKGGLVMIDPNAELIDVIDGQVRPIYYNRQPRHNNFQQRMQPIFTRNGNY